MIKDLDSEKFKMNRNGNSILSENYVICFLSEMYFLFSFLFSFTINADTFHFDWITAHN